MQEKDVVSGFVDKKIITSTINVIYPLDRYSTPDEKARKLSEDLFNKNKYHQIIGVHSANNQQISESMILVYDALCENYILLNTYEELKELYKPDNLKRFGSCLSFEYDKVQNAYLTAKNATIELPNKENSEEAINELFDLMIDIRLIQARQYRNAQISKNNRINDRDEYKYENESEIDVARAEGFDLDDDGNWIPADDDYWE